MRNILLAGIAVVALGVATPAFATNNKGTNTHSGVNFSEEVLDIDDSFNVEANGGNGGRGGDGGNGLGIGVGGESNSRSGAGVFGSGNSESQSGVFGSGNSRTNVENDIDNRNTDLNVNDNDVENNADNSSTNRNRTDVDTDVDNDNFLAQGQVGIQEAETGDQTTNVRVEGDSNEYTYVNVNPVALSNLPVAVCQGESSTVSLGGAAGIFGGTLGGGHSEIDEQCTRRENIRLVASLAKGNPVLQEALMKAIGGLEGFESVGVSPETGAVAIVDPKAVKADRPGWCEDRIASNRSMSDSDLEDCKLTRKELEAIRS